jgi:hypothetical protein
MKSIGRILAHNEIMTSEYLTDADYQGSFLGANRWKSWKVIENKNRRTHRVRLRGYVWITTSWIPPWTRAVLRAQGRKAMACS